MKLMLMAMLTIIILVGGCKSADTTCSKGICEYGAYLTTDEAGVGEKLQVNLNIAGATDITGLEFNIAYDSELLTYESMTFGNLLGPEGTFFCVEPKSEDGIISGIACAKLGTDTISGSGIITTMQFTGKKAGTGNIRIEGLQVVNSQQALVDMPTQSAKATIN